MDVSTENKLNRILLVKLNMQTAIQEKGVAVENIRFSEYANKIRAIQEGVEILDGVIYTELNIDGQPIKGNYYSSNGLVKNYEFYRNSLIEDITFMNPITEIGTYAFFQCPNLVTIDLSGVNTIGSTAFDSCILLENIVIGSPSNPIMSIGSNAFVSTKSGINITIYKNDPSIPLAGSPWGARSPIITYMQA